MDLRTTYMGLELKHPIIASASPLSSSVDGIKRLEDSGAAAVTMFSLFEEQIQHENDAFEYLMESGSQSFAESLSYFPNVDDYGIGSEHYLEILHRAAESVDIPIFASLNGISSEGWMDCAKRLEQAGASGLELNIYLIPVDIATSGQDVEAMYLNIARSVKQAVSIPVALKLSPFFSSPGNMIKHFDELNVDGLVLFNRFLQPDFDIEQLEVVPILNLSSNEEIRLPLMWIALLYGKVKASLAATRGVQTSAEVIKYLLAGADAVMTASALLRNGPAHIHSLVEGLRAWMEPREYQSVQALRGVMSQQNVPDPSAFVRANYLKALESYKSPYVL